MVKIIKMKNKKGIELSINFLVMLILAIVIFSMGLVFAFKIVGMTDIVTKDMDEQTKNSIKELLINSNSNVAIPMNNEEVKIGKTAIFYLGIANRLGEEKTFLVDIDFSYAYGINNNPLCEKGGSCNAFCQGWFSTLTKEYKIKNNDYEYITIPISVKKEVFSGSSTVPGTYIFNINVQYENASVNVDYGKPQKIMVTAK